MGRIAWCTCLQLVFGQIATEPAFLTVEPSWMAAFGSSQLRQGEPSHHRVSGGGETGAEAFRLGTYGGTATWQLAQLAIGIFHMNLDGAICSKFGLRFDMSCWK